MFMLQLLSTLNISVTVVLVIIIIIIIIIIFFFFFFGYIASFREDVVVIHRRFPGLFSRDY